MFPKTALMLTDIRVTIVFKSTAAGTKLFFGHTYRDGFYFSDSSRDLLEVLLGCYSVQIVVYDTTASNVFIFKLINFKPPSIDGVVNKNILP